LEKIIFREIQSIGCCFVLAWLRHWQRITNECHSAPGESSFQNANLAGQFLVAESVVPSAVLVPIGHAPESGALNHEEFNDKRRRFICGLRLAIPLTELGAAFIHRHGVSGITLLPILQPSL
jgi:hypothetical protein